MTQSAKKKHVIIDKRANKELATFSRETQLKFKAAFEILEEKGVLEEPFAKKIIGIKNLFEIRIKHLGQWRSIYSYYQNNLIVILSAFQKRTQKTPIKELLKAKKRQKDYE